MEWIRSEEWRRFIAEVSRFQAVPVEAVDASGSAINYHGLDSLCERAQGGARKPQTSPVLVIPERPSWHHSVPLQCP